jgi:hypothetical protein
MVRASHVINLAPDERIVKRYHVARKPAFPEINRYLTVTNQRVIMETRVESILYGMEVYDEAHLDVIKGTTVGYEKKYNLGALLGGIILLLYGIFSFFAPPLFIPTGPYGYSPYPDPLCLMSGFISILIGIVLLIYSRHEAFYLKLKMMHIGDIDFGVLKKGLALLSLKPGPDADAAIIELGALIKTLQKNPNFSFASEQYNQMYNQMPPQQIVGSQYSAPQYSEENRQIY